MPPSIKIFAVIVAVAALVSGCDGLKLGVTPFGPSEFNNVSVCYGTQTMVGGCSVVEARLCNSGSEKRTVKVCRAEGIGATCEEHTYEVQPKATMFTGPFLGYSETRKNELCTAVSYAILDSN